MSGEASGTSSGLVPAQDHHPKLYFPQGDIVLSAIQDRNCSASEKGKQIIFRVHAAVLAHHSPVFAGMLSLPTSPEINATYDGAPLVHMPDDATDLAILINALYDATSLVVKPHSPDNAVRWRIALQIAAKYQVDFIRTKVVQYCKADWPQTPLQWLRFRADFKKRTELVNLYPRLQRAGSDKAESFPEPVSAINLAKDFDIPCILPAAFYLLALVDIHRDYSLYESSYGQETARWTDLAADDMLHLFRGKGKLRHEIELIDTIFDESERCPGGRKRQCDDIFVEMLDEWKADTRKTYDHGIQNAGRPDVLQRYTEVEELLEDVNNDRPCATCRKDAKKQIASQINRIWDELPKTFGFAAKSPPPSSA